MQDFAGLPRKQRQTPYKIVANVPPQPELCTNTEYYVLERVRGYVLERHGRGLPLVVKRGNGKVPTNLCPYPSINQRGHNAFPLQTIISCRPLKKLKFIYACWKNAKYQRRKILL